LSQRYVARYEQRASAISLTLTQCKALAELQKNEGISQVRLAELTGVEPMTMVRILDRMESDQLIERRPDPDDRRARRLYLTDKGQPLVAEVWRMAELTRAELFTGIGQEEIQVFMRVLEQLHANTSRFDSHPLASAGAEPDSKAAAARAPRSAVNTSR
jgi:DNA-binding MarR family transcriptional regulator